MSTATMEAPRRALSETAPRPRFSVLKRVISWFATLLILAMLGIGLVLAVIPALNHGTALTVLTGSMQPTINPGDIAVVYAVDGFDDISIGDVVTFMPNPDDDTLVTHRAVGWSIGTDGEKLLVTRGDANSASDPPIMEKQLRAKLAYTVPWLGNILQYSDFSKPFIVILVAIILIGYAAYATLTSIKR
ncbi:MAG: signal peptidase I [Propionibacteriaceae bacterium]|jgi:signal peptidase|nr:signal peptidase I [Propionibacteriaceae bacterium]